MPLASSLEGEVLEVRDTVLFKDLMCITDKQALHGISLSSFILIIPPTSSHHVTLFYSGTLFTKKGAKTKASV